MTFARTLVALLALAAVVACSSAPPPAPPAPHPGAQPGAAAPGGDVLPPQARSAQPPARPVNPMLQQ